MKTTFLPFILVALCGMLTSTTKAQTKTFREIDLALETGNISHPLSNVRVYNNTLYAVGLFTSGNATPNGQSLNYNNLIQFPECDLNNPSPIGGGITTMPDKAIHDVAVIGGVLYAVGDGLDQTSKLFQYTGNSWIPKGNVTLGTADEYIGWMEPVNDSVVVLIGNMNTVNGVQVNKICLYNLTTDIVTPVGSTLTSSNEPLKINRSKEGLIAIAGRTGISTYDIPTNTFTVLTGLNQNIFWSFIAKHDTFYVVGLGIMGNELHRKIGTGNWQKIAEGSSSFGGISSYHDGTIILLGNYSEVILANNTVITGSNLAYNEKDGSIVQSDLHFPSYLYNFIQIPNGEYVGWSTGGRMFTTEELVSGVTTIGKQTISLYPNPAQNFITIEGAPETQVTIVDIQGRVVKTEQITGKTLVDVQNLTPGMYFVHHGITIMRLIITE